MAAGLYTALSGPVGALYYDPLSGVGLARSQSDSVNAYFNSLNPFADWSWGAYFHEVGQFSIGEGKGAVNFAAGTVVYTSPELLVADDLMGGRLSSPLAASGESQAAGAETSGALLTVASMLTGEGEVAAGGRAAQRLAGAESRAATSRFHSGGDPLADVLGPAHTSHPEEYAETLKAIEGQGGEVLFRNGQNGYAPGLSPGKAGQVILDPDASIGAVRHEYQHFLDDEAAGRPGYNSYFDENSNPMARWKFEIRGYRTELKIAKQLGNKKARHQLLQNARAEKKAIFGR